MLVKSNLSQTQQRMLGCTQWRFRKEVYLNSKNERLLQPSMNQPTPASQFSTDPIAHFSAYHTILIYCFYLQSARHTA